MKFSLFVTVSSIAVLVAQTAAADENEAVLVQSGASNSAAIAQDQGGLNEAAVEQLGTANSVTVTQTGDRNGAAPLRGTDGLNRAMRQEGDNNTLSVDQSANRGRVGHLDDGVDQIGDRNVAVISQTGNRARLGAVQQTGVAGAVSTQNSVDVLQGGGGGNFIRNVTQTNTDASGAENTMTVTQTGNRNIIGARPAPAGTGLLQDGSGNLMVIQQTGDDNGAGPLDGETGTFSGATTATGAEQASAEQIGTGNAFDYLAEGDRNLFGSVQIGTGNFTIVTSTGDGNQAASVQIGDGNDTSILQAADPIFGAGGNGNAAGASVVGNNNTLEITQFNNNNSASDTVLGNRNQLFTGQAGNGNTSQNDVSGRRNDVLIGQLGLFGSNASTLTIDGNNARGNDNFVTLLQAGRNTSDIDIFGDRSDIDIVQTGTNTSSIVIAGGGEGDDNTVTVSQSNFGAFARNTSRLSITGDDNVVALTQSGSNLTELTINGQREGDNNTLNIDQSGGTSRSVNSITATINGDGNNTGLSFTGADALTAAGTLTPGDMFQSGTGNQITLTVGDDLVESGGNAFAFSQIGADNTIIGSITDGGANQVAVVQVGTASLTNFSQVGSFNVLGVSQ
ncbi:hypothetical protein KDD17_07515 [Sulfitobacter albidus]|uniref:Curlin associated repeat-containing protein n=1 Tax=Sulfitobacter albidus TaxID=2829501 RepID=A0A975PNS8_9RHOB|nr:hypothetical protein [Sulfitobacter albidus]QUJ77781.1 hypothetical protein KDD17_07515 [Sulfitobacter albidus]